MAKSRHQKPVEQKHEEILSVLGLLILNRFREITYEEVIAMLKFDLMDTVAGRQLYDMGKDMGRRKERVNTLQETVLDALEARFELVPHKMIDQINMIDQPEELKSLHGEAIRCPNIGAFKERLSS